jgi:Bacterial regulatory proteins, gntR family
MRLAAVKPEGNVVQLPRGKGQFERLREKWLDQIYGDPKYYSWPDRAILAYLANKYINRKTFTAWPVIRQLEGELHASHHTIRKALNRAAARGHLKIDRHKGTGQRYFNHVYTPLMKGSRVALGGGDAWQQGATYTLSNTLNKKERLRRLNDSGSEERKKEGSKEWPGNGVPGQTSNPSNAGDLGMNSCSDNPLPSSPKGESPEVPRKLGVRWNAGRRERPRAWGLEASSPEEFERSLPSLVRDEEEKGNA